MGAAHSVDADAGEPERGWSVAEPPADVFLCVLAQLRRDWPARAAMRATCRGWARLADEEVTWKAVCGLLAAEYPLAVPTTLAGAPSWRALFLEAHPGTARFHAPRADLPAPAPCAAPASDDEDALPAEAPPPGVFTIDVCVRFRPPGLDGAPETAPPPAAPLVVPLHARFQMLKARHGGGNLEAARRVWGAKAADADPWATARAKEAEAAAAEAASRAAAAAAAAAKAKAEAGAAESAAAAAEPAAPVAAAVLSASEDAVLCLVPGTGLREFRFRRVFDDTADAAAVYDGTAARLVAAFCNGTSGALLAYGQTGAGKTHSLHGPDEAAACALAPLRKEAGVVPRAAAAVLAELDRRAELARLSALGQAEAFWAAPEPLLFASYVEIYGEEVRDLLSASAARVGAWGGVAAAALAGGAAAVRVRDAKHLETLLATAEKAKKRAATAMNARSSRAHALLTLRLVQPGVGGDRGGPDDAPPLVSWLVFADLGGCERVKRSGVEGERLAEAVNINLSLLALQNCIAALAAQNRHVPFADSRLTALLAAALSGEQGRVALLLAARSDPGHGAETLRTLRFGETAARAALRADGPDGAAPPVAPAAAAALRALEAQIGAVEAAISAAERWEGGKPVGAEAQREQLAGLLAAKRALCGEHQDSGGSGDDADEE